MLPSLRETYEATMLDTDRRTALAELIDHAALDEARWPDVLRATAEALGAPSAALVRQDHRTGRAQAIEVGLDPAAAPLFVNHYSARNVLRQYSEIDDAFGRRAVAIRPQIRDLLRGTEYYNDFLRRFEIAHLAWTFLDRDGDAVTLLNVGRAEREDAFDAAEIELLTWLMPHLMRAYAIGRRLGGIGAAAGSLVRYLDLLPHGVVLLDALGRILHANRAANAIVQAGDGLSFGRDGVLVASMDAARRLEAAIARAADPACPAKASSLALPRPSGLRPYVIAVCPFGDERAPLLFGRPSVLLEIRDLTADEPAADAWLAECLSLTPAESHVAGLLLAGHDRDAIATRLGIAGNTVRVHIARLMGKTDTHRQAELVHLLERVAAMRRVPPR